MLSLKQIQQQVLKTKQITIVGGQSHVKISKPLCASDLLDMSQYQGVTEYYPEELVITLKAGTKLTQLKEILAKQDQTTPFELSSEISNNKKNATIGGAYAMGNSDLRNAILGVKIIDGRGQLLTFGGQVMKNVAGYDVARLLVGSKGKVAIIYEISLKTIPKRYAKLNQYSSPSKIPVNSNLKTKITQGIKKVFDPELKFI